MTFSAIGIVYVTPPDAYNAGVPLFRIFSPFSRGRIRTCDDTRRAPEMYSRINMINSRYLTHHNVKFLVFWCLGVVRQSPPEASPTSSVSVWRRRCLWVIPWCVPQWFGSNTYWHHWKWVVADQCYGFNIRSSQWQDILKIILIVRSFRKLQRTLSQPQIR